MTATSIAGTWERQRARLSHDRIKNQILPMTSRLCRVLDGRVESPGFVTDFSTVRLGEIEEICGEIEDLLATAEEAASPRVFFSIPPLNQCPASTLAWLPQVLHEKWMEEMGVRARTEATQRGIDEVRCASLALQSILNERAKESNIAAIDLQNALLRLADCLSDLGTLIPYRF